MTATEAARHAEDSATHVLAEQRSRQSFSAQSQRHSKSSARISPREFLTRRDLNGDARATTTRVSSSTRARNVK